MWGNSQKGSPFIPQTFALRYSSPSCPVLPSMPRKAGGRRLFPGWRAIVSVVRFSGNSQSGETRCRDGTGDEVPRARISPSSPKPLILPRDPPSALVKPSSSSLEGRNSVSETEIDDVDFRNFHVKRPSRHTSPLDAPNGERQTVRAYPLTNGIAGGKLPRGNLRSGSPRWSFSAAVR
jgi:hypothetical protein